MRLDIVKVYNLMESPSDTNNHLATGLLLLCNDKKIIILDTGNTENTYQEFNQNQIYFNIIKTLDIEIGKDSWDISELVKIPKI